MSLFSSKKEEPTKPTTSAIDAINTDEIEDTLAPEWYKTYKTLQSFPHIQSEEEYTNLFISMEAKDALEEYVKEVMPEPSASLKIYQKLTNEDVNVQEVANLVSSDPLLAARVLKLVNSAAYGFSAEVTSVGRAVTLLGLRTIKQMVLSESMKQSMKGEGTDHIYNEKIRIHSAMVSAVAQHLSTRVTGVDSNEIATVALLHDIGKILYRQVIKSGRSIKTNEDVPPLMVEAILASVFADIWQLPESISTTLEFVPYPLFYPMDELTTKECHMVTIIQAANYIVNAIDSAEDGDRLYQMRDEYLLSANLPINPGEWILPTMVTNIEKSRKALE